MIYFLKKSTPSKKGVYLQIYTNSYNNNTKKKDVRIYKTLGYVSDLISKEIPDPITYYKNVVIQMNKKLKQDGEPQISINSTFKFAGHFLISSLFNLLNMDDILNIIASSFNCHYNFSDMFKTLCYCQILSPGSKLKAFERVVPNIYNSQEYSYDQILDATSFIGSDYHKYIEMLNKHINAIWGRNYKKVYFDCTNYYFEIDAENSFLKKGPSKENRKLPLLGQALMLDADQIPLDTCFYPGNESEKPYLRKRIEDMKTRNNVTGRVIQVADKGLNCARNIYSATVEAKDGYIFSKSIKGTSISKGFKDWITKEDDKINKWITVKNEIGETIYKYKEAKQITSKGEVVNYGDFEYSFENENGEIITFVVKEKRIVTYNPTLARKQKIEILKEVENLKSKLSYKTLMKQDLGDCAKYANFTAVDKDGKKVKIASSINQDKVNEDLKYAGYNMLVTSEIYADPEEIYNVYHNLWRIEESFRLMKSYLEARPVFASKEETIYGHFLICYFCLTLMRLLELKIFNDEIPMARLFDFIRQYNVTKGRYDEYINNSTDSKTHAAIKEKLGLAKLGNLYLSKKDLDLLFETELD